ncbi:hypothetical protein C922_05737 [Plasmodium inui San Antonio 1]|uniref:Uncharacterized protein n=1 Tax=Plasmodium inui San Antonio 1 TaxID=1237626 RepID=W6ZX99_9APIC|nr:hypothetical protein C922_05737 [Plasmodium inui San Antonio 1]EUD63885.1 hypothetical protein C922_05737 [Plasmodium inui San Antonio 1]
MRQTLTWKGKREEVGSAPCDARSQGEKRFCFHLAPGPNEHNRPALGIGRWIQELVGEHKSYNQLSKGFREGSIKTKNGNQELTWEDLLNSVIKECLKATKDKKNDGTEDKYLTRGERGLWAAYINGQHVQCNSSSDCQPLLYLIGCVIYWLWADQGQLINNQETIWAGCNRLRKRLIGEEIEGRFRLENNWAVIKNYGGSCGADDNFKNCQLEALSLVIDVFGALRSLCPSCPYQGINNFLTGMRSPGPKQRLYCEPWGRRPDRCVIGPTKGTQGLTLLDGEEFQQPELENTEAAEAQGEGEGRQGIDGAAGVGDSGKTPEQDKEQASHATVETALANGSQVTQPNKNEKPEQQEPENLDEESRATTQEGLPGQSGSTSITGQSRMESLPAKPASPGQHLTPFKEEERSRSLQGGGVASGQEKKEENNGDHMGDKSNSSVAGIVGGSLVTTVMLLASGYGLYRIYGRRKTRRGPQLQSRAGGRIRYQFQD